jgi:hypothetical protein
MLLSELERQASDVNTPPEQLRRLAAQDTAIAQKVAQNPSTDLELLLELGAQFPTELLNNPIFPLLMLENPALLTQMPITTLRSILRLEEVPVRFLNWAAAHPDPTIQRIVVQHRSTPKAAIEVLAESSDSWVKETVAYHRLYAEEVSQREWKRNAFTALSKLKFKQNKVTARKLVDLASVPEFLIEQFGWECRVEVAKGRQLSMRVLERLATDLIHDVRWAIAANPQTPPRLLEKFAKTNDWQARACVAANPQTPPHLLEYLLREDSDTLHGATRRALATNPNLPVALLSALARDKHRDVRCQVAHHPRTPADLLVQILAETEDADVGRNAARHPNLPQTAMAQLASCDDDNLRSAVARNPQIPVALLITLASDPELSVRKSVALHPGLPEFCLKRLSQEPELYPELAQNPSASSRLLARIVDAGNHWLCSKVAGNPAAPDVLLAKLASQEAPTIDRALAQNPHLSPNLLAVLSRRLDPETRLAVAYHPATPGSALVEMCQGQLDEQLRDALVWHPNMPGKLGSASDTCALGLELLMEELPMDVPSLSRFIVLMDEGTPATILSKYMDSLYWPDRFAIAQNPNTPDSVRLYLSEDIHQLVQATARACAKQLTRLPK